MTDLGTPTVALIIGLIIAGLVITLGGGPDKTRRGFQYWKNPGAVARAGFVDDLGADRFLAILSVVVQAAFSFLGMELVVMCVLCAISREKRMANASILCFLVPLLRLKAQGGTSRRRSRGYSGASLSSMCVSERLCLLHLTYNPVDRFLVS